MQAIVPQMEESNVSEWQPINTAPKGKLLLYFPAMPNDRYGHGAQIAMYQVGAVRDYPFRIPSHWIPLPEPPK